MESERKAVAVMAAAFFSSGDKVMVAVEPGFRYTVRKVGISEKNILSPIDKKRGRQKRDMPNRAGQNFRYGRHPNT